MVRRVGFGDDNGTPPAVRRRGERGGATAPQPASEDAPPEPRERSKPAPSPWGGAQPPSPAPAAPRAPDSVERRRGLSLGRLVFLGLLWLFVFGSLGAHYGGLAGLRRTAEGVAEGWLPPEELLVPLGPVLAFALVFSWALLRRRRRR